MAETERKPSLQQQMSRAERIRERRIFNSEIKKKKVEFVEDTLDATRIESLKRTQYINKYCRQLVDNKELHPVVVSPIRELMIKYNIYVDKFIPHICDSTLVFNVYLIKKMLEDGSFKTSDFEKAGCIPIDNAFDVNIIFAEMLTEKHQ